MKFTEQLYEAESEQKTKEQIQRSSFDDRLLSSVVETIKRDCNRNVSKHRLVGYFDNDTFMGDLPSIQPTDRERIPRCSMLIAIFQPQLQGMLYALRGIAVSF